ncbi:MAG: hypothetical protein KIT84_40890 [Labilithrix sp.]|nr:hypothetical protein [Labilithrix sp.]MCW5817427.1 hypothetical protein [Labilithrix sp.]
MLDTSGSTSSRVHVAVDPDRDVGGAQSNPDGAVQSSSDAFAAKSDIATSKRTVPSSLSLTRLGERDYELWIDAIGPRDGAAAITLRLSSHAPWAPTAIVPGVNEVTIADAAGRSHVLSVRDALEEREALGWREGPLLEIVEKRAAMACLGTRLVPVRPDRRSDNGSVLHGAIRPAIVAARAGELSIFDGSSTRTIAIPLGLGDFVAIESPFGSDRAPLLLEMTVGDLRPMVWWCARETAWLGFRLRDELVPQVAITVPGRGVLLAGAVAATKLAVHKLVVRRGRLARDRLVELPDGVAFLRDRSHRRVWTLCLSPGATEPTIQPLALRGTDG